MRILVSSRLIRIYSVSYSVFDFLNDNPFAIMVVSKFKDERVPFRNSGVKVLTIFCRLDSYAFTLRAGPFAIKRVSGQFLQLPCFIDNHVFNANSVDPDQTPRSAASDLDLHCLQMSLLWSARLKWVKMAYLHTLRYCNVDHGGKIKKQYFEIVSFLPGNLSAKSKENVIILLFNNLPRHCVINLTNGYVYKLAFCTVSHHVNIPI